MNAKGIRAVVNRLRDGHGFPNAEWSHLLSQNPEDFDQDPFFFQLGLAPGPMHDAAGNQVEPGGEDASDTYAAKVSRTGPLLSFMSLITLRILPATGLRCKNSSAKLPG